MNSLPFYAKAPSKLSTKDRFPRGGCPSTSGREINQLSPVVQRRAASVKKSSFLVPNLPTRVLDIYHCLPLSENPTAFVGAGSPQLTMMLSIDIRDPVQIWNLVSLMPLQVGCGQTISASLYVAKVGIMTLPTHRMMCFSGKPSTFWFLFLRQTCRTSYILILKKRTLTHEVWWPILRSWSSSIIRALDHHNPFCSFNTICPVVCCFSVPWLIWLTNPRPWMGDKNQKANYWEACIWPSLSPAKQMLIYWRQSVIKETRFHIWSYQRIIYNHRQCNCSLWGTSNRSCRVYTQWKTVIKMSKNASNWFWRTGNTRRVRGDIGGQADSTV